MKILHIVNDLSGGGAEKLLSDLVPSLRDKGHEVEVLILKSKGVYLKVLDNKDINIISLSRNRMYSFFYPFTIRTIVNKGKYDIVNVHIFPSLYYFGLAAFFGLRKSTKIVYTEHSTHNNRRNNLLYTVFDKFIYKQYDRIIAISLAAKKTLISHLKCNSNFVTVINNGIDTDLYKYSKPIDLNELINGYDSQDKYICMVSRFNKAKDQATLIQAVSFLPNNYKLLLVGDSSNIDTCVSLVEKLNISDRVFFLGFRQDIPHILKACDVGVLSSNWEGMPLAALEIFASEKPFIGSKVPGIEDLFVDEDDTDVLFKHKDSKALSLLIKKLLEDKKARNNNKEICQRLIKSYSLETMSDSYFEVYSDLLKI